MTVQIADDIVFNGKRYELRSEPFESYIENSNIDIYFPRTSTANLKGYYTKWKIENNSLYLTELDGSNDLFTMETLFNTNEKVLAKWYTGELIIPFGEKNKTSNDIYLYKYKHEMRFQINKGKVISMVVNWDKN